MSTENKAIIRRYYDELLNQGNMAFADQVYAPDVELHIPGLPEDPYSAESVKQMFAAVRKAFPGVRVTVEDLVAEEDRVAARIALHGPHQGAGQASPYDRVAAWARIDIFRLVDGKIVEQWADRDDVRLMAQFGVQLPSIQ